jgi:hypothetical protein
MNSERERLLANVPGRGWKHWGPYLSERQWGTVREDYSPGGTAWDYFPHDHARSRAYRWGEDGIAGMSDAEQLVCLSLALWNGRDAILKERLFGLTNSEGNHGEDVKEHYFYLDATPTHSYLKMLYKYPQRAFPYADLVAENARRGTDVPEYELIDTGAFAEDRYFDVFVEYAQAEPGDILMKITAWNRGPEAAVLHLIPQLVLRNTWTWEPGTPKPLLRAAGNAVAIEPNELGASRLYYDGDGELLFTENESNGPRLWNLTGGGYYKDGFHERIVNDRSDRVNPAKTGTKAGVWRHVMIPAGDRLEMRLRLSARDQPDPFAEFDRILTERHGDADQFYAEIQKDITSPDERAIQRQAFAGMIWNKQFYHYDVHRWLKGDPGQPVPPAERKHGRNSEWNNLNNADILSLPDKWEYPWFASWDLAFHCIPFALIDAEFAKHQLVLLTREWYMRGNGQIPAYEWAFGDVNPPVHGWAAWRVYQIDRKQNGGAGDLQFLERVFHKLMLNFTWWVNRKDQAGRNIFQGGFLGLDNIGVFDRSAQLPTGGYMNQSDGTSWMAMYALNLMRIALELAEHNHVYEDIASKFFEHFLNIASAMAAINNNGQGVGLWDEQDQFYYDVLNLPDDSRLRMRIRSMVGLIPLFAVETLEPEMLNKLPGFRKRLEWFLTHRPDLAGLVSQWQSPGQGERRLLSLLRGHRMKALLRRMLDESEFLSDHGVRSLSRTYLANPYTLPIDGANLTVRYVPAESDSRSFGGNSNWRGPIWFPVNFLIIESLQKFHHYYGDDFKVECPTGSGNYHTLHEVAVELSQRLARLFLRDDSGNRAVLRQYPQLQTDPHYRDYIPFYEFFDGDNGRGAGASHQTGWTGLIAKLLMPRGNE